MSDWHRHFSPEKQARQRAQAAEISAHFHICRGCGETFDGPINWDSPVGSNVLLALCGDCFPLERN